MLRTTSTSIKYPYKEYRKNCAISLDGKIKQKCDHLRREMSLVRTLNWQSQNYLILDTRSYKVKTKLFLTYSK